MIPFQVKCGFDLSAVALVRPRAFYKRSNNQEIQITTRVLPANAAASTDSIFAFIPVTIFKFENPRQAKRLAFKDDFRCWFVTKREVCADKICRYYLSCWSERFQNVFCLFDLCRFREIPFAFFHWFSPAGNLSPANPEIPFLKLSPRRVLLPSTTLNQPHLRRAGNQYSC